MRRLAYPAAILLLFAGVTTAHAGVGLPKLAAMTAGGYQANVYTDSYIPHVGANMFSVELDGLPEGAHVSLKLVGPKGQTVSVPLKPLTVISGPEGGHGEDEEHGAAKDDHAAAPADAHGAAQPAKDDHAATPADHQDAAQPAKDDHGAATDAHGASTSGAASLNTRGTALLDQTGEWTAILEIEGHEGTLSAEAPFVVEEGGPNRLYLTFTGLLMGGTMVYGAIARRTNARNGR